MIKFKLKRLLKRSPFRGYLSADKAEKYHSGYRRKIFSSFDAERNVLFFIRFLPPMRPVDPEISFPNLTDEENLRLSA